MRLLYSVAPACDPQTLKRLMLVGTQLCFMDRPSVMFGQTGTVGVASPMRPFVGRDEPVTIEVYEPPSGPARHLYAPFFESDLSNPEFVGTVLAGLRAGGVFAANALQLEAAYHPGITGEDIRRALVDGPNYPLPLIFDSGVIPFLISTPLERANTLALVVQEFSIQVTSAMVVAEETGAHPVATEPILARLLATRARGASTEQRAVALAPYVGFEFTRAVIPDEALAHLTIDDVIRYRRESADAYDAWTIAIDASAAQIDDVTGRDAQREVEHLIATDLRPKLREYKNAMVDAREKLFADLIKSVTAWQLPTLSVAYLSGGNITDTIAAFAAGTLRGAAPPIVDYLTARRKAARNSPASYLIGIAEVASDIADLDN
jgi:hypothetical protein